MFLFLILGKTKKKTARKADNYCFTTYREFDENSQFCLNVEVQFWCFECVRFLLSSLWLTIFSPKRSHLEFFGEYLAFSHDKIYCLDPSNEHGRFSGS